MECRTLDLTISSANDLKKVTLFSNMEVYVVVSVQQPTSNQNQITLVEKRGNISPTWNFPMKFTLNEAALQSNSLTLCFKLFARRTFLADKLVGECHMTASDLISSIGKANVTHVSHQMISKRSGKTNGVLNLSYRLGDTFTSSIPAQPEKVVQRRGRSNYSKNDDASSLVGAFAAVSVAETLSVVMS